MSTLLWEDQFYESGEDIATRIGKLVAQVAPEKVAAMAIEARNAMNLRHVPLLLLAHLCANARGTRLVGDTLPQVIQRPDELSEFLAIYAKVNGVTPDKLKPKLSNQVRKGLAAAFGKFSEYSLQKYNRDGAIKLRDVLFLCHAKPKDTEQAALWQRLIDGTLATPDTWETQLSGGADKRETFERLIREGKLGYLALLRNLRNMEQAGCDRQLVMDAIVSRQNGAERVLPFRFVAAARNAMSFEPAIDIALCETIAVQPKLPGKTIVLVDVSGSMHTKLSAKSDMNRMDAAAALASLLNAEHLRVLTFSDTLVEVPPRRGMAGVDAIIKSQYHGGTRLVEAVHTVNARMDYDRFIVITDEQAFTSSIRFPAPKIRGYMINVASYQNGIGYGPWVHLDGFSESVIRWIYEYEQERLD